MMTTYDREEWERILANAQPTELRVTSGAQSFTGGTGIEYLWLASPVDVAPARPSD